MAKRRKSTELVPATGAGYDGLVSGISELLEHARRGAARSVNSILTAAYWEIGRRIVEFEQGGKERAEYGEGLLVRPGGDLTARHGRGFSWRNLCIRRNFYLRGEISQTVSAKFAGPVRVPAEGAATSEPICQTLSDNFQFVPATAPLRFRAGKATTRTASRTGRTPCRDTARPRDAATACSRGHAGGGEGVGLERFPFGWRPTPAGLPGR